jgi:endonuclease/exonuclease/phosphatase (EEP) superfamily protein YafD
MNFFAIFPYYLPAGESCPSNQCPHVKVFSANLWGGKNRNYQAALTAVHKANPDVVGFSEVTRTWAEKLTSALAEYPYRVVEPQHGGIALFSKFPIRDGQVLYSSALKRPRIEATVLISNRDVKVIVAHPFIPDYRFALRNSELAEIANDAKKANEPAIVIGDLNCTPWSYYFNKLERDGGLIDSERGFGIQRSGFLRSCPSITV